MSTPRELEIDNAFYKSKISALEKQIEDAQQIIHIECMAEPPETVVKTARLVVSKIRELKDTIIHMRNGFQSIIDGGGNCSEPSWEVEIAREYIDTH